MHISALQTFLAVVETGNLNKAAERLNITQSAVTARLDALEERLGQPLLVRSRRGAQLTRAGFAFRPYAETVVRGWDLGQSVVGLPKGYSGLFSFACEFDLWENAGKKWLETHRIAHPDLAYEAWPGARSEIKTWLENGLTDAALTLEPILAPGLASREHGRERLVQVATAPRSVQAWDPDYIYVDLGAEFRRQHAETWTSDQTASITYAASAWALDHLKERGGSAYLPWSLVKPHFEAGSLHPVVGAPEFTRTLMLVWREASQAAFPWIDGPMEDNF